MKYIDIIYHFLYNYIENKEIKITYIPIAEMTIDILTKLLNQVKYKVHTRGLGLYPIETIFEEVL
jgi:hypothetical protein